MSRFQPKKKNILPGISTASLPDIVFMLLFFFMVATRLKDNQLKVTISLPQGTEIKKLEKKSLVSFIYVGEPRIQYQKLMGTEPVIQLNDAFSSIDDIQRFIEIERKSHNEKEIPLLTTSLKVDSHCRMGIVTDIKQELRRCNALKINYSCRKRTK
ncbi:MAG: biopolymer transporter ExbD [Bacteroidia bacterium]|nr:biopolymer transporter ExbD [Bacteroidia bacterium]